MRLSRPIKYISGKVTAMFICAAMIMQQPASVIAEDSDHTADIIDNGASLSEVIDDHAFLPRNEPDGNELSLIGDTESETLTDDEEVIPEADHTPKRRNMAALSGNSEEIPMLRASAPPADAVCQIETSEDTYEYFTTIKDAVTYAQNNGGTATIEMLTDFTISSANDTGNIDFAGTITITSADPDSPCTIYRGWNGAGTADNALFYVNDDNANLITTNIKMDGNSYTGRAIYDNKGSIELSNGSTFVRFKIDNANGGAIYHNSTGDLIISGTTFGALKDTVPADKEPSELTANDVDTDMICKATCSSNKDYGLGGTIYTVSKNRIIVTDTSFYGSTAGSRGGGIYLADRDANTREMEYTNCRFIGNKATLHYGAAVCEEKSVGRTANTELFSNCVFIDNESKRGGSAILIRPRILNIENCVFKRCTVTGSDTEYYGGAIYILANDSATIMDSEFSDCTGAETGGAIQNYLLSNDTPSTGNTFLDNVTITRCTAKLGSAVYSSGNVELKDTVITDCVASWYNKKYKNTTYYAGGAIQPDKPNSQLYFIGKTIVRGNRNSSDSSLEYNVILSNDNNTTIQTNAEGLDPDADIGIYVTGATTSTIFKNHGENGDPFGTYDANDPNLYNANYFRQFKNDRNGLYGTRNGSTINWEFKVTAIEGQFFSYFDDPDTMQYISRDSSFTSVFYVNNSNPKLMFTQGESPTNTSAVSLPVGTSIIMRINENKYFYTKLTSAASTIALNSFSPMGGHNSGFPSGEYTAQFIIDFSQVEEDSLLSLDNGSILNTGIVYGTSTDPGNSYCSVTLTDKTAFGMTSVTGGNDLAERVIGISTGLTEENAVLDGSTVITTRVEDNDPDTANGRATKWEGRDMALVVTPTAGIVLPRDAKLIVKTGNEINDPTAAGTEYHLISNSRFIVPIGTMTDEPYDDMELVLVSDNFPVGETTYTMTADLMASGSLEEGSPLNGTVLASSQLAYKAIAAEMPPSPSLKITSDIRAVKAGGTIDFDVKTINSTSYKITAVICQKGNDWDHTSTVMNETVLKNSGTAVSSNAASPTSIPLSFTAAESSADQSYMLVVCVKDSNDDIVMTVPYYFIAVCR